MFYELKPYAMGLLSASAIDMTMPWYGLAGCLLLGFLAGWILRMRWEYRHGA